MQVMGSIPDTNVDGIPDNEGVENSDFDDYENDELESSSICSTS